MSKSERPYTPAASRLSVSSGIRGGSGDDLNPVLVSGFGRLSWVGADGGLTGFGKYLLKTVAKGGVNNRVLDGISVRRKAMATVYVA